MLCALQERSDSKENSNREISQNFSKEEDEDLGSTRRILVSFESESPMLACCVSLGSHLGFSAVTLLLAL